MLSQVLKHNMYNPSAHHLVELLMHNAIYELRPLVCCFQYQLLKLRLCDVQTAAIHKKLALRFEPPAEHAVLETVLQHH